MNSCLWISASACHWQNALRVLHCTKFLLFSCCHGARWWLSSQRGKSLGIFPLGNTARVYLSEFGTERAVQVNEACKHFPTAPKRNVFWHDTSAWTCWAGSTSEMKEILARKNGIRFELFNEFFTAAYLQRELAKGDFFLFSQLFILVTHCSNTNLRFLFCPPLPIRHFDM